MDTPARAIGVVGLGKMGLGIGRRLLTHGYDVTGFDRDSAARSGAADSGIVVAESVKEVVAGLDEPRTMWLMVPAGAATEEVVLEMAVHLSEGDLLVDGGNSYYRDSMRRAEVLASGEAVERAVEIFDALSFDGRAGWRHVGPSGSGHFVKMIHNGIEYGMMQALAEGLALLEARSDMDLDLAEISELWRHGSIVSSRLLDHVTEALSADARLSDVSPYVADSGEGRWMVQEAVDLAVPAPVITLALLQRFRSRIDDSFADRLLSAMRLGFGGHQPKHP